MADGTGQPTGRRRDEYGPTIYDLTCDTCGATWCGETGDPCQWCQESLQRLLEDQRTTLLWPPWLHNGNGPRYDELSDVDRQVWDRTRGVSSQGSVTTWIDRLGRAVTSGLVTQTEATAAIRRQQRGVA
jgi:hypothetical protein